MSQIEVYGLTHVGNVDAVALEQISDLAQGLSPTLGATRRQGGQRLRRQLWV